MSDFIYRTASVYIGSKVNMKNSDQMTLLYLASICQEIHKTVALF